MQLKGPHWFTHQGVYLHSFILILPPISRQVSFPTKTKKKGSLKQQWIGLYEEEKKNSHKPTQ